MLVISPPLLMYFIAFHFQKSIQLLLDQVISFFHVVCHTKNNNTQSNNEQEFISRMGKLILYYFRDLVRISLERGLLLVSLIQNKNI